MGKTSVVRQFCAQQSIRVLSGACDALATPHPLGPGEVERLVAGASWTARFHNLDTAMDAGYALLTDAAGIACIDDPGVGGMGIHYVKGELVADPRVRASQPEALVYEPRPNGRLRLVAVEWVVLRADWEAAGNTEPPELFGWDFELVDSGNRYGLPPFYELHAWIWKHNPRGMFDDWNPRVSCAASCES